MIKEAEIIELVTELADDYRRLKKLAREAADIPLLDRALMVGPRGWVILPPVALLHLHLNVGDRLEVTVIDKVVLRRVAGGSVLVYPDGYIQLPEGLFPEGTLLVSSEFIMGMVLLFSEEEYWEGDNHV